MTARTLCRVDWGSLAENAQYHARSMAKLAQTSLRNLERFFEEQFGRSPQFWLNELRLVKSAILLLSGETVKNTANRFHFCDPSHFSRKFKEYFGCTPTQFVEGRMGRAAARVRQLESYFPGQPVSAEWMLDSSLARAEESLLDLPYRRRVRFSTAPLIEPARVKLGQRRDSISSIS